MPPRIQAVEGMHTMYLENGCRRAESSPLNTDFQIETILCQDRNRDEHWGSALSAACEALGGILAGLPGDSKIILAPSPWGITLDGDTPVSIKKVTKIV